MTFWAGDIVYFTLLGQQMVVIGSIKAAFDLLDKKSANFSGRPVSTVAKLFVVSSFCDACPRVLTGLFVGPAWTRSSFSCNTVRSGVNTAGRSTYRSVSTGSPTTGRSNLIQPVDCFPGSLPPRTTSKRI